MGTTAASDADLAEFVRAAKAHGIADEVIVSVLRQNGWPERRVYGALAAFYSQTLGMSIPVRRQGVENARDAFYYLLNFITLGFWTVSLGQIFYILVAHWFPDPTRDQFYARSLRDAISWQIASVIVTFPIFLFVHNLIQGELRKRPDLYDSGVRKWLTYLALVIAAIIVLTDAVWFIEALIQGEVTVRFIIDSLVLLVLGGGVFIYYLKTIDAPAAENEA